MPTVADEFIVKLSVDGSGISKGAKDAEKSVDTLKKGTKEAGEASKKAGKDGADAFAAFRREAVGALALFTGGKSLAGFANDITKANTALGNMAQQLDIAPQKLNQLHQAMKSVGGNESSVDSFLGSIQAKASDPKGRGELTNLGSYLGVNLLDEHNHVRADAIEQLNKSQKFRGMSRGVQNNYVSQLGGNSDITTLANQTDLGGILQKYATTSPSDEQIRRSQQMLADWTELKANTDKISQQALSELEPTAHNFVQALIDIEKAHPDAIAHGVEAVAAALTLLSAALTARRIASMIKLATGIGGISAAGAAKGAGRLGIAGAATYATDAFFKSDLSHKITGSIADGEKYVKDTWGLNKTMNDLLQRDIDRRHQLIDSNSGLLSASGVAVDEWADIAGTGASALFGSSDGKTAGSQPRGNTRGERNNNPGNLNFAGQRGAHLEAGSNGRFAAFNTPEDGLSALKNQLTLYNTRDHLDTVSDIISKYAPASDNNHTADYIEAVAQKLHAGKDQHLGKLSPAAMAAIMHGIIGVENGHDRYGGMVERIAGLSNIASSASAQNTTHTTTNTTHAPVVHVNVANSNAQPHEIAHAVSSHLSNIIANGQTGRVG